MRRVSRVGVRIVRAIRVSDMPIARTKERMNRERDKVMSIRLPPRVYVELVGVSEREKRTLNSLMKEAAVELVLKRKK